MLTNVQRTATLFPHRKDDAHSVGTDDSHDGMLEENAGDRQPLTAAATAAAAAAPLLHAAATAQRRSRAHHSFSLSH